MLFPKQATFLFYIKKTQYHDKNITTFFANNCSAISKLSLLILYLISRGSLIFFLYIVCGKQASNMESNTSWIYKPQVALFRSKYCNWPLFTVICGANFSNASTEP